MTPESEAKRARREFIAEVFRTKTHQLRYPHNAQRGLLRRAVSWVYPILAGLSIGCLVGGCIMLDSRATESKNHRAYEAWCKHTGNPGNLSYYEWRDMAESSASKKTTIIPVLIQK